MTASQIKSKADRIRQRLKEHDGKRKIIEAELLALQHACPHTDVDEWDHHDYGGGHDHHWLCKNCGLQRVT